MVRERERASSEGPGRPVQLHQWHNLHDGAHPGHDQGLLGEVGAKRGTWILGLLRRLFAR
eukprot:754980-Alexandrium_andersonii.AAC.1